MPNRSTISIWGLWTHDQTIFDDMAIPASIDGSLLVDNILLQCSELEILYPDAGFLKSAIAIWSKAELPTWDKLAELNGLQYNPIENYDRTETETVGRDKKRTMHEKSSGASHAEQNTEENSNNAGSSSHNVTGYNTNTPVTENTDNSTGAASRNASVKDNSGSSSSRDGNEGEQENQIRQSRIHGNIGVTSSQEMIKQSIDLAPQLNVINYITESFKLKFCILVY